MDSFVQSQFEWIKTFDSCKDINNITELCNGIQLADVLRQISPSHFTSDWFNKLKQNPENWRLRISNLKKILDKINDYYDNLMPNYPTFNQPDLNKIGKDNDDKELSRLIQLILGIAVNCEQKHQYIGNITKLDLSIQQNLMEAIQQLMSNNQQSINQSEHLHLNGQSNNHQINFLDSLNVNDTNLQLQDQFLRTMENLRLTNEKKEAILQQNYELNKKLIQEQNEKLSLQNEYERLLDKYNSLNSKKDDLLDFEETDIFKNKHFIKLQRRIEQLEKDLIIMETQKEENLIKLELVEKEVLQLRLTNENLQRKAKETQHLKDELDVHKFSADKIHNYEQKIDIYQKKIEEFANLKREFNQIEKKNIELVAKNLELEEELKKPSILKQQVQDYKKKIKELNQEIIEKTRNSDKLEFDLERQNEKINYLNQEKIMFENENYELKNKLKQLDKNLFDQLNLKDEVDSLQLNGQSINSDFNQISTNKMMNNSKINNCLNYEINDYSNDLKEKLTRLELENKLLKTKLEETNQEAVLLLRTSYQDAKTRVNELEKDNRLLNRQIVELESKLNEQFNTSNDQLDFNQSQTTQYSKLKDLEEQLRIKMKAINLFNDQIYDLERKIQKLEGQLSKKDDEFNEIKCKYKKYVEKAKQAIGFLEPISFHLNSLSPSNSSVNSINNGHHNGQNEFKNGQITNEELYSTNNIDVLKKALIEKDNKINEMTINHERERNLCEMEQRLITVAFHNLSFNLTRSKAFERCLASNQQINQLDNLSTNSSSNNLLAKHRKPTARKLNNLNNNLIG